MIEVAHEDDLTPHAAEQRIAVVKLMLDERGLAHKPFGLTYTRGQSLTDEGMRAPGLIGWRLKRMSIRPASTMRQTCSERPPAPSPGPAFVPSADCTGWVPVDHPLARLPRASPISIISLTRSSAGSQQTSRSCSS